MKKRKSRTSTRSTRSMTRRRRVRAKVRIRRVVRRARLVGAAARPRRSRKVHKSVSNPRIRLLAQALRDQGRFAIARAGELARKAFQDHESSGRARSSYRIGKVRFSIVGRAARQRNPVPASSVERRVQQAGRLYQRFSGHEPSIVGRVARPERSDVLVAIGRVDGIMYSTVRDGRLERFIHEFAKSARPLFAVSHDGKQLEMLGGAYDFTARGIVDRTGRRGAR